MVDYVDRQYGITLIGEDAVGEIERQTADTDKCHEPAPAGHGPESQPDRFRQRKNPGREQPGSYRHNCGNGQHDIPVAPDSLKQTLVHDQPETTEKYGDVEHEIDPVTYRVVITPAVYRPERYSYDYQGNGRQEYGPGFDQKAGCFGYPSSVDVFPQVFEFDLEYILAPIF